MGNKRTFLIAALVVLVAAISGRAQQSYTPTCNGTDDTAAFQSIITGASGNPRTIEIPHKDDLAKRCAVGTITIPSYITLDNTRGSGITKLAGQTITVQGPVVNPAGKTLFFGSGTATVTGNAYVGQGDAAGGDLAGTYPNPTVATGTGANQIVRLDSGAKLPAVDGSQLTNVPAVGGASGANPTASVGLTAVNGSAGTFMRSDAAPPLSQSIAPTWTGIHTFGSAKLVTPDLGANTSQRHTVPAVTSDTLALLAASQGFTNKTYNGLTVNSTTGTLALTNLKTLTVQNSLSFSGTDAKALTLTGSLTVGADTSITGGGTIALGGFTFTVPATGTAVLTSRTITEGSGLAGNTYDLSANRTIALGTPSTLTVSTANSASGTTHSHAITSSSNPGAVATLLASDSGGMLTLVNVLHTSNSYIRDTSTGFTSPGTTVVSPLAGNAFRSTSFTSGLVGWNIGADGSAEFENADIRGAIHAGVIVYNAQLATAGTLGVFQSAAKLKTDITVTASPTYNSSTFTIDVTDQDGLTHAASQLFGVNDILQLKDGLTGRTWFKVTAASDLVTFWRYTATIMAGTSNVTYRAGLGVADYGVSGKGFIIATADQTNAPYIQMATHAATFTSLDANGTLTVTPQQRTGNLNGSYGYNADVFGTCSGQYGAASKSWICTEQTNGIRIGNNTTQLAQWDISGNILVGQALASQGNVFISSGAVDVRVNTTPRIHLAADGSGYLANALISWDTSGNLTVTGNASIAGWTVNSTYFAKDTGTNSTSSGMSPTDFPFFAGSTFANRASAPFRVTPAGALTATSATISGTITATSGTIGGWTINATTITGTSSTIDSAGKITLGTGNNVINLDAVDTTYRLAIGNATYGSAPFRVDKTGAMTATSGTIGGFTLSSTRISSTNLFFDQAGQYISGGASPPTSYGSNVGFFLEGANSGRLSLYKDASNYLQWDNSKLLIKAANFTLDSSGNVTATSATLSGAITSTSGSIGGWTLGATSLTSGSGSTTVGLDSGGTNPAFYAGSATPGSAPFRVTNAGALTATNATISGAITATSGTISGTVTVSGAITGGSGVVSLDSTGIGITSNSGFTGTRAYRNLDSGTDISDWGGQIDAFDNIGRVKVYQYGTRNSQLLLQTDAQSASLSTLKLSALKGGAASAEISLEGNTSIIAFKSNGTNQMYVLNGAVEIATGALFDSGVRVGTPTGGDKGVGTINVSGDIYKNNTAYTNPDFVFEKWATGSISKFADKPGAKEYEGLMPLDSVRSYVQTNLHLPRFGQDARHGVFSGGEALLTSVEELYLYVFQLEDRLRNQQAEIDKLKSKSPLN